jgi:hypothetical protein
MNMATLIAFYLLFRGGPWFAALTTSSNRPHWEGVVATLNIVFYYSFLGSVIVMAAGVGWDFWTMARKIYLKRTQAVSAVLL